MATVDLDQLEAQNTDAYDALIVTVTASEGVLSLFLAVCDDTVFREQIIQRYEAELAAASIPPHRAQLNPAAPSLRAAVAAVVEQEPQLQSGGRGVITVLGADALLPLVVGDASRSQQAEFLGYLQWTREVMLAFKQPIILWVTSRLLATVWRKAPDFWSWRKDVFRFQAPPRSEPLQPKGMELLPQLETPPEDDGDELPIEELLKLVEEREQQENAQDDPILATLYFRLGVAYKKQGDRSGAAIHRGSVDQAIAWLNKAAQLQAAQDRDQTALATMLNNLAELYRVQGKYEQAEPLFLQALEIRKKVLGEDHSDVALSLNNLAALYYGQGKYEQAEPLFLQALEIRKKVLGEDHSDIAITLNNLAELYRAQGKYEQAEPLFLQNLAILKKVLRGEHSYMAHSLNNLALLYEAQGKYEKAKSLFLQALEMRRRALGEEHPYMAHSLNNLAALYESQGKYEQAEPLYLQAIEIANRSLGGQHPHTQILQNNFRYMIEKAHQAGLAHTLSDHPLTQSLLQEIRENEAES
ncbi:MAG: tetratricopeptide repeat protein [Cyanobacteria bacterium P01_G01_bin.54]